MAVSPVATSIASMRDSRLTIQQRSVDYSREALPLASGHTTSTSSLQAVDLSPSSQWALQGAGTRSAEPSRDAATARGLGASRAPAVATSSEYGRQLSTRVAEQPASPLGFRSSPVAISGSTTLSPKQQVHKTRAALAQATAENRVLLSELEALRAQQDHVDSVAERLAKLVTATDALMAGKALHTKPLAFPLAPIPPSFAKEASPRDCDPTVSAGVLVSRIFSMFDSDGDGMLSAGEFSAMLARLGYSGAAMGNKDLEAMCGRLDIPTAQSRNDTIGTTTTLSGGGGGSVSAGSSLVESRAALASGFATRAAAKHAADPGGSASSCGDGDDELTRALLWDGGTSGISGGAGVGARPAASPSSTAPKGRESRVRSSRRGVSHEQPPLPNSLAWGWEWSTGGDHASQILSDNHRAYSAAAGPLAWQRGQAGAIAHLSEHASTGSSSSLSTKPTTVSSLTGLLTAPRRKGHLSSSAGKIKKKKATSVAASPGARHRHAHTKTATRQDTSNITDASSGAESLAGTHDDSRWSAEDMELTGSACLGIPLEGLYRLYALAGRAALMRDARLLKLAEAPALHAASVLEAAVDALGQSLMVLRVWDATGHAVAGVESHKQADAQAAAKREQHERQRRKAAELEAAEMAERLMEATRDSARWKRRAEEAVRDALSTRAALHRLQDQPTEEE